MSVTAASAAPRIRRNTPAGSNSKTESLLREVDDLLGAWACELSHTKRIKLVRRFQRQAHGLPLRIVLATEVLEAEPRRRDELRRRTGLERWHDGHRNDPTAVDAIRNCEGRGEYVGVVAGLGGGA